MRRKIKDKKKVIGWKGKATRLADNKDGTPNVAFKGKFIRATDKALAKEIRKAKRVPAPPSNPFVALLTPVVIVPEGTANPPIIADAGSIVRLMDQRQLYRDWTSPITRRGDELLVQYGPPKKLKLGWITNQLDAKHVKPTKPPTFLVMSKKTDALTAWDQLRLLVANARKRDESISLGSWLATHGEHADHQRLLREVTREFGGTPIKNEPFADRFQRLCLLILRTELDMATHKKTKKMKKGKKGKVAVETKKTSKKTKATKATKTAKTEKPKRSSEFSPRSKDFDNHIIRRLIKENPRRAGTTKFKLWAKIKKGMTVGEFAKLPIVGAARSEIGRYIEWGWIKLLPPNAE